MAFDVQCNELGGRAPTNDEFMCSVTPVLQFMEKLVQEARARDFLHEQGLCGVLKFDVTDSSVQFCSQSHISAGLYPHEIVLKMREAQHHHLSELTGILQAARKSRKTTISLNKVLIWSCLNYHSFSACLQLISHIERIFGYALVLLPSTSLNRVHAIELRNSWRYWLENSHLVSRSISSKSLIDLSVDAEIDHMLQAIAWKTEFKFVQHATPQFSQDAHASLLDTQPTSKGEQLLFSNMDGRQSR